MLFLVFVVMWFVFLGKFVADVGLNIVQEQGLTGVEAFFYSNLNMVIFVIMILGIMGFMYFGANQ